MSAVGIKSGGVSGLTVMLSAYSSETSSVKPGNEGIVMFLGRTWELHRQFDLRFSCVLQLFELLMKRQDLWFL